MHVRMKTRMAGPQGTAEPGAVIEVEVAHARVLVDGGFAEALDMFPLVTPASAETTALTGAPETTGRRRGGAPK